MAKPAEEAAPEAEAAPAAEEAKPLRRPHLPASSFPDATDLVRPHLPASSFPDATDLAPATDLATDLALAFKVSALTKVRDCFSVWREESATLAPHGRRRRL